MSHSLYVLLDMPHNSTQPFFDALESSGFSNSSAHQAYIEYHIGYLRWRDSKIPSEDLDKEIQSLKKSIETPSFELGRCYWLDENIQVQSATSIDEARKYNHFEDLSLYGGLLPISAEGFRPSTPVHIAFYIQFPDLFFSNFLGYKKVCRNLIASYAAIFNSSIALFFNDNGISESIPEGHYPTKSLSQIYRELAAEKPPMGWDEEFSEAEAERDEDGLMWPSYETMCNTYFVDHFQSHHKEGL